MNARILKKLSKKVYEITGDKYGWVWLDRYEPFADEFLNERHRHSSRITGIFVVGGELDYFGEPTEIHPLFHVAQEDILWTLGKENVDFDGVDYAYGWPSYPRRLTGMEVIKQLRKMHPNNQRAAA